MGVLNPSRPATAPRRAVLRTLAAIFGGLAAALALTVLLASHLPFSPSTRGMLAVLLSIPTWVGAAFYAFLDRSAERAGIVLILITMAAGLAAWLT